MACKICEVRRPRRACPGVGGEICAPCCGTQREETVSCPLDCAYLREARSHEKPAPADPEQIPNRDIQIDDSFLQRNEVLLAVIIQALARATLATAGAVDYDVREALMKKDRDARLAEVARLAATEVPAGVPMSRWALAWCLRNPAVTAVIPGCKSPEQVRDNAAAAELDINQS